VSLHDRFTSLGWLANGIDDDHSYEVTPAGEKALEALGFDIAATRALRRRFAFACVDWSKRRPHLGGALGAALLQILLRRRWIIRDPDGRALTVTSAGRRELLARFGMRG
jgi:hypothetical protein